MTLLQKQKMLLRKQAHTLNPVVSLGSKGLTPPVHKEIDVALKSHELIKLKVSANDKDERKKFIDEICQKHDAELIQSVGHKVTIYRANKDNSN